jgi:hypothetical protein
MLRAVPGAARVAEILAAAVPEGVPGTLASPAANDAQGSGEVRSESAA